MLIDDSAEAPPIRQCIFIKAPPEKVFHAIATSEGWNAWFTDETEVDAHEGGSIVFRWTDSGPNHRTIEDRGPVLRCVENREFVFQWRPGVDPTTIAFTLAPLADGTRVDVVESGYTLRERDLKALVDCSGGWGEALALLKFYLEYGVVARDTPWPPSTPEREVNVAGADRSP